MEIYGDQPVTAIAEDGIMIAESETPLGQVADQALSRSDDAVFDPVVVTTDGKYSGLVPMSALIRHIRAE